MAIRQALDFLIDRIEATTPASSTSHGFVCIQNADGYSSLLSARPGNIRYFDLGNDDYILPSDDGDAGLSGRKRATHTIRVRYDTPADIGLRERIMSEDATTLIDSIKLPDYSPATTQITTCLPGSPVIEPLFDDQGIAVAWLLKLPVQILYKN